jgi:phospholipid/cholesterol/gamma-HCH transport system substrate-binding protein
MVSWTPSMENVYRGYTLHINLETIPNQPRGYGVQDDPQYADERGPIDEGSCRAAPRYSQQNLPGTRYAPTIRDGVDYPVGKRAATGFDVSSGFAGTSAERSVVNAIASTAMGVSSDEVPDVATLLFGPLARGTEVSMR